MDVNSVTEKIIGSAIEVHRAIGPGLLEQVYEECLAARSNASSGHWKRSPILN